LWRVRGALQRAKLPSEPGPPRSGFQHHFSEETVEKSNQNWYFTNGFQSLKSGWPYFLFWKKSPDGETIY
jgi:hypothetical protein